MLLPSLPFPLLAVILLCSFVRRGHSLSPPSLDPVSSITSPDAAYAQQPLLHLGGNGPWFRGMSCMVQKHKRANQCTSNRFIGTNVHGIPLTLEQGCEVDQAAYVLRHGSRYPDKRAYSGWLDMLDRVGAMNGLCIAAGRIKTSGC